MKNYRVAIGVAAVFIVLLVVVLVTSPNNNSSSSENALVTPTLSAEQQKLQIIKLPDNNGLNRIEIKQSDPAKSIAFKLSGNWVLEGQENFPLDSTTVATTISQLSTLSGNSLVEDNAADLSKVGLDKPSLYITLASQTYTKTLQVGITNTVTGNYYVKLADDNRVWTLNSTTITDLKQWITSPPVAPPTATPLPTLPATNTPQPTPSISVSPELTPAAGNVTSTPVIVATGAAGTTAASPAAVTTASGTTPAASTP